MNIRPSAAIRQNYNEIAYMCRKTAEPVLKKKNGDEKKGNDMYNALSNLPLDQQAVASNALGSPYVQNSMLSAFNMNPSMLSSFAI